MGWFVQATTPGLMQRIPAMPLLRSGKNPLMTLQAGIPLFPIPLIQLLPMHLFDPGILAGLPQGMYLIGVATDKQQQTMKFVKE
jgi:hypothetical protein